MSEWKKVKIGMFLKDVATRIGLYYVKSKERICE